MVVVVVWVAAWWKLWLLILSLPAGSFRLWKIVCCRLVLWRNDFCVTVSFWDACLWKLNLFFPNRGSLGLFNPYLSPGVFHVSPTRGNISAWPGESANMDYCWHFWLLGLCCAYVEIRIPQVKSGSKGWILMECWAMLQVCGAVRFACRTDVNMLGFC